MNSIIETLNALAGGWWHWFGHASWQAAAVAALVLGLVWAGRRWPAPLRYALLLVALVKFVVPPMFSLPTGLFSAVRPEPVLVEARVGAPEFKAVKPASNAETVTSPKDFTSSSVNVTPRPITEAPLPIAARAPLRWQTWLMLTHLLGSLVTLAWILRQWWSIHLLKQNARRILDGPLHEQFKEAARIVGMRGAPALMISSELATPVAFGIFAPTVLLPATATERLPESELRTILAHELTHFHRGDLWVNTVQLGLLAVWWFHPLLWLLHRTIQKVREDCCDDVLLARDLTSGDAYCDALLHTARELAGGAPIAAALGFGENLHPLGRRLKRIMDDGLKRSAKLSLSGLAAVIIVGGLLLPGVRSQPFAAVEGGTTSLATKAVRLAANAETVTPPGAEGPSKSDIQTDRSQVYPWSEDSEYVRVAKSLLRELSLSSVTITNNETRELVLTDEFIKAFKLTPPEIDQVSRGITNALHEYRTVEGKHLVPANEPENNGPARQPAAVAGEKFNFRLIHFPEEAAAIWKRLEETVLSSLGEERTKFFWEKSLADERSKLFWENGGLLNGEMNPSTKRTPLPPDATERTTYSFMLSASVPGQVERTRTKITARGGSSQGQIYGERLDPYAPEALKPVLARWRKTAAKGTPKNESPSALQALPSAQAKESVKTNVNPVNPTGSSKQAISQSVFVPQSTSRWENRVPFVDLPKTVIKSLKIPGLTLDEEFSAEAARLFGLSTRDQEAVSDLYNEMKSRFEKLERAHFERTGRNSFVLKAFPEESAALKREWVEKLKKLTGRSRGEMLDQSIRMDLTPSQVMKRDATDLLCDRGESWLHRGTAGETRLEVKEGVGQNGPKPSIHYQTKGGNSGSDGMRDGKIPQKWQHLLTLEMLAPPSTL